jgi:L-alanine-DL-glutamate epimerase-like enolase superfamily enzyme
MWDLAARSAGKPLWRLLTDMSPQQLVDAADLSYLSDAITRSEAIAMLDELMPTRGDRIAELEESGYPATRRAPAGSATATRSSAASCRRPSTRATGT